MPYILVRGNLASYGHRYPWRVLVSGLKGIVSFESLSVYQSLFLFKLYVANCMLKP